MKKIVRLTEGDINKIVRRVIKEDREIINEQLVLTAGIMLFRQTAYSKTNRLIKHIKKELKRNGFKSRNLTDGGIGGLVKCIAEFSKTIGDETHSGRSGMKQLARKKDNNDQHSAALAGFEDGLSGWIKVCLAELGYKSDTMDNDVPAIQKVILSTIDDFAKKKIRL